MAADNDFCAIRHKCAVLQYYFVWKKERRNRNLEKIYFVCFMQCLPETVSEIERGDPPILPLFLSFPQKTSLAAAIGSAFWHASICAVASIDFLPYMCGRVCESDCDVRCVEERGRENMRDDEVRENGCGAKALLRINCERTRKWGKVTFIT